MAVASTGKDSPSAIELERADPSYNGGHLDHKIYDGDEALKVLHGEYEPYTKEEERRVLRKIDLRMIVVMLIINGLQFVDKNVSLSKGEVMHVSDHVLNRPSPLRQHMVSSRRRILSGRSLVS